MPLTYINWGFNVVRGGLNITAPLKTPPTHTTVLIHVVADISRQSHCSDLTVFLLWATGETVGPLAVNQYCRLHEQRAFKRASIHNHCGFSVCMHAARVWVSLFALGILGMSICARGRACVCLCLMSLITGHRPDSHQVLS